MPLRYGFVLGIALLAAAMVLIGPARAASDLEQDALRAVAERRWGDALPLLRKLTAAEPNNQLAWYYLARAGLNAGDRKDYAEALKRAAKGGNESIRRHAGFIQARLKPRFRPLAEIGAKSAAILDKSPYARSNRDAKIRTYTVVSQEAEKAAYTITQEYKITSDRDSLPGLHIEDGIVTIAGQRAMQAVTQSVSILNGLVELYRRYEEVGDTSAQNYELRFDIDAMDGNWPFWTDGGVLHVVGARNFRYPGNPAKDREEKVSLVCEAGEIDKAEPLPTPTLLGIDIQERESRLYVAACRDRSNGAGSYTVYLDTAIGLAVPGSFAAGARSQGAVTKKAAAQ